MANLEAALPLVQWQNAKGESLTATCPRHQPLYSPGELNHRLKPVQPSGTMVPYMYQYPLKWQDRL